MGVEVVVGSASGALLMMAKSKSKESIGVCVGGWRDAMNLSDPFQALLLYLIGLRTYRKIAEADVSEGHA
jgi:hypothetical protein